AVLPLRGAAALALQPRARALAHEYRQRGGALGAVEALHGGVAARDQDASAGVDRVREEVAEAAVLPGGHARGATLAHVVVVDQTAGGIHHVPGRVPAHRVQDRGVVDRRLGRLAVQIHDLVSLVPDHRDLPGLARGDPRPVDLLAGRLRDV